MSFLNVKNRAESTLDGGINDAVTELAVAAGEGALFPASNFHITIDDEILLCSSRSTDTLTVVREQEGTTGVAHDDGAAVELRITAGIIDELQTAIDGKQDTMGADDNYVTDTEKAALHASGSDTSLGAQTEDLDMNTHSIGGVVDPTTNQQAATKKYVDDNEPTVPVKAIGAEVDTGTDDAKFATAKAITDSKYFKSDEIVTLTNKRITDRVKTFTSDATPDIDSDDYDAVTITAQAAAITDVNVTGTPTNFQRLIFRIKDNATARAITWGDDFEDAGVALPTTTVVSKLLTVGFIYNTVTSKWGCVAVGNET